MYPTVADVLALPVIRQGTPRVVAGAAGLDRRVRWVHVAEIADIAPLLRGGELVLTTGVMLPDDPGARQLRRASWPRSGCAGLVIELVRHWRDDVPAALVTAAERHGLPLVTLSEETRFVAVTEAVVGLIVDAQVAELRAAEQVHETFTALTVAGAEPAEVLREVARTSGLPVVLETLGHDVLAYDAAGHRPGELLADWAARSRAVTVDRADQLRRPSRLAGHGGRRARQRLGPAGAGLPGRQPPHRQVVVAERAASALAVHRLVARDREGLERHAHRTLLHRAARPSPQRPDLAARAAALGVPLERRQLLGVCGPAASAAAAGHAWPPRRCCATWPRRPHWRPGGPRSRRWSGSSTTRQRARAAVADPAGRRWKRFCARLAKEIHQAAATRRGRCR